MIRTFLAALALLFATAPASAYWEYGHETVAEIAWANIKPATKVQVRKLLARAAVMDTPQCPAATIEQASVWADCVKPLKGPDGKGRFDYAYSWHYQNVNVCQPFDLTAACKDGNCVSAQIEKAVATLRNRVSSEKARVEALLFLVHLVGDLHQPMHAGDKGDRGGNDLKAAYGIFGPERFGLHQVWDGPLPERAISTPPSLVRRYSSAERARLGAGSVTDWSRESWQVSRDVVYAGALGGDACVPSHPVVIDEPTIEKAVPVLRDQLAKGGIRLARLLDEALAAPGRARG